MQLLLKRIVIGFTPIMMFAVGIRHAPAADDNLLGIRGDSDSLESSIEQEADFLPIEVETASAREETLQEAPATMMVITAQEIKQRGYTDLPEVIKDLPGFDVVISNGTAYMTAYQRGYRTLYTSRTLFMVNGVVDNMLWSNEAAITRQYPLSNIKQIEVLYGPASAVYGPNAFLGIINIITNDAATVNEGEVDGRVSLLGGDYESKGVDASIRGKLNQDISFSISGKFFQSDEPDLSNRFEFLKPEQFNNQDYWGPLLGPDYPFGAYNDPTDDYGILANVEYKGIKLGMIHWKRKEAYGPYYVADRVQNNALWNKDSDQYFAEYNKQWTDRLKTGSLLLYRNSRRYGYWVEGDPTPNAQGVSFCSEEQASPDEENKYSCISYTHWNSISNSWLFKQNLEFILLKNLVLSGGFKFESKELTKGYDIPGYWDPGEVASSISSVGGFGDGIGHSTDLSYNPVYPMFSEMQADNLEKTRDIGGYIQGIFDMNRFRVNLGVRYDKNSIYGDVINPRFSAFYKVAKPLTFKFLYGTAFQEPPPILLWGGWTGREANPNLGPEKARNFEWVGMYQTRRFFHEISLYYSRYTNVIREGFESGKPINFGERNVKGLEYRGKYAFPNLIPNSPDMTGYFNYTFTDVTSDVYYNPDTGAWSYENSGGLLADGMGDIAPHKFNFGINMPIMQQWNLNLRGNFVGERELDPRNTWRSQATYSKLDSYLTFDGVVTYTHQLNKKSFDVSLKVLNMLDKDYFHPGVEGANSGRDSSSRSLGYMNSLIPQPGRSWWINVGLDF